MSATYRIRFSRARPRRPGPYRRNPTRVSGLPQPGGIFRPGMDSRPSMDGQSENLREPQSEPVVTGLAPLDELQTGQVPDSLVSDFSSLTTPYCWVITEDAVAGSD